MVIQNYEPQRDIIMFGNGAQGRIIDQRGGLVNQEGIEEVEFLIQPSREMMTYYGIDPQRDLDQDGFVRRRFPKSDVKVLNRSNILPTTLLLTGFGWEHTELTLNNTDRELIQDLQMQLRMLQRAKAALQEENRKLLTQTREWAKEHADIIQEFKRTQTQDELVGQLNQQSQQQGGSDDYGQ